MFCFVIQIVVENTEPTVMMVSTPQVTPIFRRGRGRPPKEPVMTIALGDITEKRPRGRPRGTVKKSTEAKPQSILVKLEDDESLKQKDVNDCFGFVEED